MAKFQDMLKYFRKRNNLSQRELADAIGVSASTISMYEVVRREPDFEIEEKLADYFNTDLDTLRGIDRESESSGRFNALKIVDKRLDEAIKKCIELPESDRKMVIELIDRLYESRVKTR